MNRSRKGRPAACPARSFDGRCADCRRRPSRFPPPRSQVRGAGPARQHAGLDAAHHRREALGALEPAGGRREPAGRGVEPRDRGGRSNRSPTATRSGLAARAAVGQPARLSEARLRPDGVRAGLHADPVSVHPGGECESAGDETFAEFIARAKANPRQDQLRLAWRQFRRRISRWSGSRRRPASSSCTCPIPASRRRCATCSPAISTRSSTRRATSCRMSPVAA